MPRSWRKRSSGPPDFYFLFLFLRIVGLFIVYLWVPSNSYNIIIEKFWFMDCKGSTEITYRLVMMHGNAADWSRKITRLMTSTSGPAQIFRSLLQVIKRYPPRIGPRSPIHRLHPHRSCLFLPTQVSSKPDSIFPGYFFQCASIRVKSPSPRSVQGHF